MPEIKFATYCLGFQWAPCLYVELLIESSNVKIQNTYRGYFVFIISNKSEIYLFTVIDIQAVKV